MVDSMSKHSAPFLLLCATVLAVSTSLAQQPAVEFYAPELFPEDASGAVCGFSPDGRIIYFVREDKLKDKLFLYRATWQEGRWTDEQLLPFSGEHNDMGGRLSPNGKKFYFTSDRPGGSDRPDDDWNIWLSEYSADGWGEARPLKQLNEKGAECCPTPIGESTILFSSDRGDGREWWIYSWDGQEDSIADGLSLADAWQWPSSYSAGHGLLFLNSMKRADSRGKDDVYVARHQDGAWSAPLNLGDAVNTEVYEDGAILSHDGQHLIFNQHDTGQTPSRVMKTEWKPIEQQLREDN